VPFVSIKKQDCPKKVISIKRRGGYLQRKYWSVVLPKGKLFWVFVFIGVCGCSHLEKKANVFHVNAASGISSLDPAFARSQYNQWAVNQCYSTLIQLDSNLKPAPLLAKNWLVDADGKTYHFQLKRNVFFHEDACFGKARTRKLVAADVVFSLNRLLLPELASPGSWVLQGKLDSTGKAFEVVNDSTLIIRLCSAFPPFISLLSMQYASIVPKEAVHFYGASFRQHPVGTGPFRFSYWQEGEALAFEKNAHYFEGTPKLDGVIFHFIPDAQTAFVSLLNGELDMVSGLDGAYKDAVLTKSGALNQRFVSQIRLQKSPYLNTEYIGFRTDSFGICASAKFRKAIDLLLNRKELILLTRRGIGTAANGTLVPGTILKQSESTNNVAKGKQLLVESGYAGQAVPFYITTTSADIGQYVQHSLAAYGIRLQLEQTSGASLREMMATGSAPTFRASWIADYPDAENYFLLFITKNKAPNGPNYSHYSNPVFDSLYVASNACVNAKQRLELFTQMNAILIRDCPAVPLYYDQVTRFVRKQVHYLRSNAQNGLDLRLVIKE